MLSAKPWKADAVLRLILSIFVCVYAGALIVTTWHYAQGAKTSPWFYPALVGAFAGLGATLVLLRRPWQLEDFMRRFIVLLVCFYASLLLGACAQKIAGVAGPSVVQMIVGALSFQGAALVLVHRFLRDHQTTWAEGFGLANQWGHAVLVGGILGCLFLPIGRGLQWLSAEAMLRMPHWHLVPEEQQAVQTLQKAATWSDRLVLGVVTILLAPLAEEILFRGILYPGIKQAGYPRLALWGTALLFGAIHFNLATFMPLVTFALVLAVLYERTNNLLACVTAHALFNGLNFASLYLAQQTAP